MNTTMITPYAYPAENWVATAIVYGMMLTYAVGIIGFVMAYGNQPGARPWTTIGMAVTAVPQATPWLPIGYAVHSGERTPLYERLYPSGKRSWRFWDDVFEEWHYMAAGQPTVALY